MVPVPSVTHKTLLKLLYMLDALNTYAHLAQGETELVTHYLAQAKVLLEHIHHTSKMCDIAGSSYDNLYLVWGLHSSHIRWWFVSEQDTWQSMEDVFQMIGHVTRIKEQNRVFFKPNFKPAQPGLQVNEVNLGKATWYQQVYDWSHNGHSCQVQFNNNFRDNNKGAHSRKARGNCYTKMVQRRWSATTARVSIRSRAVSNWQRQGLKTKKGIHMLQSSTKTSFEMPCKRVALQSMGHHSPEHQRWPTPQNKWSNFWGTCS